MPHCVHLTPEEQNRFIYFIHKFQSNEGIGEDLLDKAVFLELMVFLNQTFQNRGAATKKNDAEKSEAERLAQMNETEKLQYQLQKQQKDYEAMQKKLNARDLKDEALKIATTQDTAFDPEFLNLFDYENMTAEQLQEKTKLIKTIQDRITEKAVNEWSKEKPPYNPDPSGNKSSADEAIRKAMGLIK